MLMLTPMGRRPSPFARSPAAVPEGRGRIDGGRRFDRMSRGAGQEEGREPAGPMAEHPRPITTVDVALFSLRAGALEVVLIRREAPPYAGDHALPGGYVHVDEDVDTAAAARRILRSKARIDGAWLEQLYTFSGPVRDPRGWSISVAYYAVAPEAALSRLAPGAVPVAVDAVPLLAFDHNRILAKALERIRSKATYSSLPAFLLPPEFTMSDLHRVYEQTIGVRLDRASFRRKIEDMGIVEPTGAATRGSPHRPAQLYRLTGRTLKEFERKV